MLRAWAADTMRDSSCFSCSSAKWTVLLLLLGSSIASAVRDRSGLFIGYSEAAIPGYGRCTNKDSDCEQQASMNRCLTDPYRMRHLCPVSCLVEPCVSQGSVLVSLVPMILAMAPNTAAAASNRQLCADPRATTAGRCCQHAS